ncbi:hypothetical protein [Spongiactinospora sp. TRM90649]|uniref:hypothetical protein n=1 Tax=Spongiactinospora sp. TRM90649 TaxID=3031114 RepID=UPI0023F83578|nr:hypothetical protein [Spongiactinospora sp. TRM90649]MDF5755417.1 hypothetical protein [Spongiactinospora sp. TRM90649]
MRVRRAMLIAGTLLGLSACGQAPTSTGVASVSGGGTASPSASPAVSSDPVKFAQCMRENGIQMDDPGGKGEIKVRIPSGDKSKLDKAHKACSKYMEGKFGGKRLDDPRMRDAMLAFAKCMRERGVDMPDPKPDEGFMVKLKRSDPKWEQAMKACEEKLPGKRG